jgi:hypothetical protein
MSETSVNISQTTRSNIPEDSGLQRQRSNYGLHSSEPDTSVTIFNIRKQDKSAQLRIFLHMPLGQLSARTECQICAQNSRVHFTLQAANGVTSN